MLKVKRTNTILYWQTWRETVRFYTEILKLEVNFSNDWFVEFVLNDSARLSIANEARASIKSSGEQGITIALQMEKCLTMHEYLAKSGAEPTPIKQLWGGRSLLRHRPRGKSDRVLV